MRLALLACVMDERSQCLGGSGGGFGKTCASEPIGAARQHPEYKVGFQLIENAGFVITGPPGSGKTPILRQLVRLGFLGVSEPARDILAEQRALGNDGVVDSDPQLFCRLMLERAIADYQRLQAADTPTFFDRGIPDMVGYMELFGLDTSAARTASRRYRYREPVFVLPAWPEIYVTDGDRRMTFESARAFGDSVREVYVHLGYSIVDVPRDSVEARSKFIAEHIQPL